MESMIDYPDDRYIAAQPGLMLVVRDYCESEDQRKLLLEPLIAWLIPGSARRTAEHPRHNPFDEYYLDRPWPVTPSDYWTPGEYVHAIVYPDGRVYEPGHGWHNNLSDWERATWDREHGEHDEEEEESDQEWQRALKQLREEYKEILQVPQHRELFHPPDEQEMEHYRKRRDRMVEWLVKQQEATRIEQSILGLPRLEGMLALLVEMERALRQASFS
jgi:hypothetical protein